MKEPKYPALLLFVKDGKEYVVIATEGPTRDHARPGFECVKSAELDENDALSFPTDTPLER